MALNKDTCGTAIKDFLLTLTSEQKNDPEYIWRGICDILFDHLKTNGEITTTVTGTADLITGDVTGTGTGTIL